MFMESIDIFIEESDKKELIWKEEWVGISGIEEFSC